MEAVKAIWTVTAGVVPGKPITRLCREWRYTTEDYDKDSRRDIAVKSTFDLISGLAYDYARSINDPGMVNWVRVDFVWI